MTGAEIRRLGRLPVELREDWEERAAIIEYEAGFDRETAEIMALEIVEEKKR